MSTASASKTYAMIQNLLFLLFAAAVVFGPGPLLLPGEAAHIVSNILCAAGLVFMFLAIVALRKVIQVEPQPKAGGSLITAGPYRWFRHPIYTGITVVIVGLFLRRPTALVAFAAAVTIAFLVVKTKYEESLLQARYPEYAEYRKRSLGVIPWVT